MDYFRQRFKLSFLSVSYLFWSVSLYIGEDEDKESIALSLKLYEPLTTLIRLLSLEWEVDLLSRR